MIRFTHIRDPRNEKRVLTIARTIEGDAVRFGYSLNYISAGGDRSSSADHPAPDVYNRKLGNKIAVGRLEKSPLRVSLLDGRHPMDAIRAVFMDKRSTLAEVGIPYRAKQIVELSVAAHEPVLEGACLVSTCGTATCPCE